eukprot:jgi/Bigna1/134158/aug1.24_g8866
MLHKGLAASYSNGYPIQFPKQITTPQLSGASFDNSLTVLRITFTAPTNEAACARMLDAGFLSTMGEGYKCVWTQPNELALLLGKGATVTVGDSFEVRNNTVSDPGETKFLYSPQVSTVQQPENPLPVSASVMGTENLEAEHLILHLRIRPSHSTNRIHASTHVN